MYNGELSGLGTDITRAEKGVPADNSKPLSRMMSLFIFLGFVIVLVLTSFENVCVFFFYHF